MVKKLLKNFKKMESNMNTTPKKLEKMTKKQLIVYINDLHSWIANFMGTTNKQLLKCFDNTKKLAEDITKDNSADWWKNE